MIAYIPVWLLFVIAAGTLLCVSITDLDERGARWANVVGLVVGIAILAIGSVVVVNAASGYNDAPRKSVSQCQCQCVNSESAPEVKETP